MYATRLPLLALVATVLSCALVAHGGSYGPRPAGDPAGTPSTGKPGGGSGGSTGGNTGGSSGGAGGGRHGGPRDVVPGGGGGGRGPTTPGPDGPAAPAPSGPTTPAPAALTGGATGPAAGAPAGPAGAPAGAAVPGVTGRRGVVLEDDLTTWDYWWEHNKNVFLRLRDESATAGMQTGSDDFYLGATRRVLAMDSLRPSQEEIAGTILPALRRAIDSTAQRDIQSSCMVAMAKIGRDHVEFRLRDVFVPRLRDGDQEVRETAALALGMAGIADADTVQLLVDLVHDRAPGRAACGGDIGERVRAFSAYGLGLLAAASDDGALRQKVMAELGTLLAPNAERRRNLDVAAIHAVGLVAAGATGYAGERVRNDAFDVLLRYYDLPLGPGHQLLQAHCPTVLAKIVGRGDARTRALIDRCRRDLDPDAKPKRMAPITQSCALALGSLVHNEEAADADESDRAAVELLRQVSEDHRDLQTRHFAAIALGQIGGAANRTFLLSAFDRAQRNQARPWRALALGLLAHHANGTDGEIVHTLATEFERTKEPGLAGALAVSLGLARGTASADALRARLHEDAHKEDVAGYVCIGLALMNDRRCIETLRALARQSARRPALLVQATTALGKLGDRLVAEDLHAMLAEGEINLARFAAIAGALSRIGDRRSVPPMIAMLEHDERTWLTRAFAAVALGGIADRRPLPWNTPIAVDSNYRAAVETFTDGTTGVLDIL